MKSKLSSSVAVTVSVFGVRHCIVVVTTKQISDVVEDVLNELRTKHIDTAHLLKVEVNNVIVYSSNVYLRLELIWQRRNRQELTALDSAKLTGKL
jgi:hypothetical protein